MNVDISPNLPPSNSCTAAAEFGEGFRGRGSSSWSLSKRVIMCVTRDEESALHAQKFRLVQCRHRTLWTRSNDATRFMSTRRRRARAPARGASVMRARGHTQEDYLL